MDKKIPKIAGRDLIDYLEKNGYKKEANIFIYKKVFAALVSDFCHFTYEALMCSKKGKLTVAYALLRKPLKDNLFYLEWLLAYPSEFIKLINNDNSSINIASEKINEQKKKDIIKMALLKAKIESWIDPQFIYEMRYDKKSEFGMEPYFQKANHLITTNPHFTTENCNFNFIFSGQEAMVSQWDQIYSILPFLLFYSFHIVESLVLTFAERDNSCFDSTVTKTMIGLNLCLEKIPWNANIVLENAFIDRIGEFEIICPNCNKRIKLTKRNQRNMYLKNTIKCYYCKEEYSL